MSEPLNHKYPSKAQHLALGCAGIRRGLPLLVAILTIASMFQPHLLAEAAGGAPIVAPGQPHSGDSVLVLVPSRNASVSIIETVHAVTPGGLKVFHFKVNISVSTIEWPLVPGYYAFLLPGLPSWQGVVEALDGSIVNVTVSSRAIVSYSGGRLEVAWLRGEMVGEPLVTLVVEGSSNYTGGLSPAGWTLPEGENLTVYAFALGFKGRVECYIAYGSPPGIAAETRIADSWSSMVEAIDRISRWLAGVESTLNLKPGTLPRPFEGGSICKATLRGLHAGGRLDYWAVAWGGGAEARSPTGTVWFYKRGGPKILVVDDDLLLYRLASWDPGGLGAAAGNASVLARIGRTLADARLVEDHDWSALASIGRLYIAFPDGEALSKLRGKPSIVYLSGLPPSIPGTPLDYSRVSKSIASMLETLASQGVGIASSYSTLAVCGSLYPDIPDTVARLSGLSWIEGLKGIAYSGGCSIVPGIPARLPAGTVWARELGVPEIVYSGVVYSTYGWQAGMVSNMSLEPGVDVAAYASGTVGAVATINPIYVPLIDEARMLPVIVEEAPAKLQAVPADVLAGVYSSPATPIMLGGGSAVFAYDSGVYRALHFTFEPEAVAGAGKLLSWAANWLLEGAQELGTLDHTLLPKRIVEEAATAAVGPWSRLNVTVWQPIALGFEHVIVAGPEILAGGRPVYLGYIAKTSTIQALGPYPAATVLIAPAQAKTRTTTTPQATTTTSGEKATTTPATQQYEAGGAETQTPPVEVRGPHLAPLVAAAATVAAILLAAAVYKERTRYKYY